MTTPSGNYAAAYPPDDDPLPARRPGPSEQSRGVALVLAIFGGWAGMHRFYVGRWKSGIAMAVTMGGLGMWWVYDLVLIGAGEFRDSNTRKLASWEPGATATPLPSRDAELLSERVDALERELGEMAERLDFTERMLTKERDRRSLPPQS